MSPGPGTPAKPNTQKYASSTGIVHNPFETLFDGGDDMEDEWWEDDDPAPRTQAGESTAIRMAQWPKPPVSSGAVSKSTNRTSTRKQIKRYSVKKPTRDKSKGRQKKQNAKAGITLVTNFSRHRPASPPIELQELRNAPQRGCFVDLAALRALNGEQAPAGGFWKSKKGKEPTRAANTLPAVEQNLFKPPVLENGKAKNLVPSPIETSNDLSPNDRPIVIGLSIPSCKVAEHTLSPQTASSETTQIVPDHECRTPMAHTPDTPTIIITPAQATSNWLSGPQSLSSNVIQDSRNNDKKYARQNASTAATLPSSILQEERERIAAQKSCFSPDSDDATNWDDDETRPSESRVVSSCTLFEEDDSPIMARNGRTTSTSTTPRVPRHGSMSTIATLRRSRGWWTYITTPFLTRSNTTATGDIDLERPPALPNLANAAMKAQDSERDVKIWEKQFSPVTPETATTTSETWWDVDLKLSKSNEQSPVLQETRHKVQASAGTLPIVLSETAAMEIADASHTPLQDASQLQRENTSLSVGTRTTSALSSGDIGIPVLSDAPNTRAIQSQNVSMQLQSRDLNGSPIQVRSASAQIIQPVRATAVANFTTRPSPGDAPPPPYSPSPARVRKFRAVLPPGHALGIHYPVSPGPVSPGLQHAMSIGDAVPMSNVSLTPPGRRPINLNSGYPSLPPREYTGAFFTSEHLQAPSKKAAKAEAERRRHEKEDAIARRAGGWWRGRGCIPKRGCYGRNGAEGRKRRRCYIGLIIGFTALIILIVVLATQLHRKSNVVTEPSQWLNITGFPPIFAGFSTVVAPVNIKINTGCVFPATQWSCDLPKELQESVSPNQSNQPNFFLHIQWDNSTAANITFANVTGDAQLVTRHVGGSAVHAGSLIKNLLVKTREVVTIFIPSPDPPSIAEESFLGNTTDGIVSANKAGEATPFYISFLLPTKPASSKRQLVLPRASQDSNDFPDLETLIPAPSLNNDGTAAPANLLPFPTQQPIRLYDRGLPTEHYGFYTYFDRSIFLKSLAKLNGSNVDNGEVPADKNGGAKESEAAFRCTWTETRFLVRMWTRMNGTTRLLNNTTHSASQNTSRAAMDFSQPGSFPYPITITTDRHGGNAERKMLYCYEMDAREGIKKGSGKINAENRGFGGTSINAAPAFFRNVSDPALGGFDGGNGGCSCQWSNFQGIIR